MQVGCCEQVRRDASADAAEGLSQCEQFDASSRATPGYIAPRGVSAHQHVLHLSLIHISEPTRPEPI
eukprot:1598262-Pyramimonas_sp.AAC.1